MGCSKIAEEELHIQHRDQFPVTKELVYLNHAAVSPLCRPAADAMRNLVDDVANFGSLHYDRWLEIYAGLRRAAAKLIHASPEEIAIVKNTSEGIATIALGLDWKAGDRIVGFEEEFPANYFPWTRLEQRGVRITWLSIYDPLERIVAAVEGARLLAISFVNYLSGFRVDLETLGRVCREHGCFFFVDAIQGLGVCPLDVEACRIDALAADGHKWLLGPEGNGILYVRREWQDRIEPMEFGWTNRANFADYSSRDTLLRPDAGRYEAGTLNTAGCAGLRASIEFLLEIGIERVRQAVDALAQRVEDGAAARGFQVAVQRSPATGSGIVSFRHPSIGAKAIVNTLERNRILAAPRLGWVRVAPHFYVAPADIDRMLELLPA